MVQTEPKQAKRRSFLRYMYLQVTNFQRHSSLESGMAVPHQWHRTQCYGRIHHHPTIINIYRKHCYFHRIMHNKEEKCNIQYRSLSFRCFLFYFLYLSRLMRKPKICISKTKTQISFAVTAKLTTPLFSLNA